MVHRSLSVPLALAFAGMATVSVVWAQDREGRSGGSGHSAALQTVDVTATRIAETVDASLADVSIITRRDIEASGTPDIVTLLRTQAGVDIARSGGAGGQTSVFLRGTNANHVLVLIDGVRVASSNTGAFAFENLPLDAIERIEIVRGPRASYWGSDAIGGVIQIFTRRLDAAHFAVGYGSYRDAAGSAGFGRWGDGGGFSVQVGARHVGGFSATNAGICNGPVDPYCIYNPDANGFHIRDAVVRGVRNFGGQTLSATAFRSQGGESFDNGNPGTGYSSTLDQALGLDLAGPVTVAWHQRLSLGSSREDLTTPAFGSTFRSTREQLDWTNGIALSAAQELVAGLDLIHERGLSTDATGFGAPYDDTRDERGFFAGWRAHVTAIDLEMSGRYDYDSDFGGARSGSVAIGWNVAHDLRLTASYGSAFRAPNLNELYSPGYAGYFAGNPGLDPERSRSTEVGFQWRADAASRFGLHAFSTRIRDLIDFSGGDTFRAINVDRAAVDGAEASYHRDFGVLSFDAQATWQNPRNAGSGAALLRRPRHKIAGTLDAAVSSIATIGVDVFASSSRMDVGRARLGGYALVGLHATCRLGDAWKLALRVDNLFDRDYALVGGYNTPGASGHLTLSWQPR